MEEDLGGGGGNSLQVISHISLMRERRRVIGFDWLCCDELVIVVGRNTQDGPGKGADGKGRNPKVAVRKTS